ncbi:MAG TPA: phage holin family protein [Solirubrobacteraceae bacterium]|nr:phage holin family protein [Solirubrobacteraceae bacterium]
MPAENGRPEQLVQTVTEISDRMTNLVRDEVELAKAEVTRKAMSLLRGTVAVAAGSVFGVFAVLFGLETIAWALDAIFIQGAGDIWLGFLIVTGGLTLLSLIAFMFAWRKLRVGPPTPTMAIDEAKQIRQTVSARSDGGS